MTSASQTNLHLCKTVCDIFDFSKKPTCFMKNAAPSILDVIQTNRPSLLFNITYLTCSISDWHNLFLLSLRVQPLPSYKNFDEKVFSEVVGVIPFHVAYVFDDVEDIYWAHETLLTDVLDEHAPVKEKSIKTKQTPFVTSNLSKPASSTNTKNGIHQLTGNLTASKGILLPNSNANPYKGVQEGPSLKTSGPQ